MAALDLEEQEQVSQLKHYWERYGNLVTGVLVALAVAAVGWQLWNWHQRKQSAEASALYVAVQSAAEQRDAKKARDAAGELTEKYGSTVYASLGAMLSARVQFDAGDTKTARAQLAWAAGNAKDVELQDLARLRLAAVLLDEKAYDEALKQLEREPVAPLAVRFAETRGDIYAVQGKHAEARSAYQAAIARLDAEKKGDTPAQIVAALREVIQIKLDALGEAG